jgi:HPt (histidine-containing phosphotransfer) domain-containing protein
MNPDRPDLDSEALENLRSIDPDGGNEFLRELVNIFLADTPRRIAEIEQSASTRDKVKLTRAAHSLKGSAGTFGASRLAGLAAEIEGQGQTSEFDQASANVKLLSEEFERLQPALTELREIISP